MKFIFLDIDGVLNSEKTREKNVPSAYGVIGVEDEKIKLLKQIVQATGAEIVLTSSWKTSYEQQYPLKEYLDNKFAKEHLKIYATTYKYEKGDFSKRGDGIKAFLKEHPADNFIILDDDTFDYDADLICKLVKTSWQSDGLKEEHVKKAIRFLTNKNKSHYDS